MFSGKFDECYQSDSDAALFNVYSEMQLFNSRLN